MAEAHTKTAGAFTTCRSASQRTRVPRTRLSYMRRFLSAVQRPTMLSPARCTTASAPSMACGAMRPVSGSQPISAHPGRARPRTSRVTRCPAASSAGTRALPTSPFVPLTMICMAFSSLRADMAPARVYPSATIPSATGRKRSSTSGSCPGTMRSGLSASSRMRSKLSYMPGKSCRTMKGTFFSKL